MKNNDFKKIMETPYFIFGVLILLGFIIFGVFFRSSLNNISVLTNAQGITVSGTAERYVASDRGSISLLLKSDSLNVSDTEALKNLADARDNIVKYLVNYGIAPENIDVLSFYTFSQCSLRDRDIWENCLGKRYNEYTQTIQFSSDDVMQIKDLSLNLNTSLNNEFGSDFGGVNVSVQNTQYFYSQFDSIKSEMLNEATKNAFERADAIARSTNNSAGAVITASQGVFQVTAKDSVDTSDYGYYDTSTIEKKINAVVRVSFKVR